MMKKSITLAALWMAMSPLLTAAPTPAEFAQLCSAKAREGVSNQSYGVTGLDGWLFLTEEMQHLATGAFWTKPWEEISAATDPSQADPLVAIEKFHSALQEKGIELILLPVPSKASLYPEKIAPEATRDSVTALQPFLEKLRAMGITVIDLEPILWEEKTRGPEGEKTYCQQDAHWSPWTCRRAAQLVAGEIQQRPWASEASPVNSVARDTEAITITGDLHPIDPESPKESIRIFPAGVEDATGSLQPFTPDPQSPVLLLGDSHTLVFSEGGDMHTRNAGLADHLVHSLGFAIDRVGVRDSGSDSARVSLYRKVKAAPTYWENKKAVIWCFTAREFTQSKKWREVPIEPKK